MKIIYYLIDSLLNV